jgi:serine/threonine protein phosphatase PrpC
MSGGTHVEFAVLTDVGRGREHNEDACAADAAHGLFVVCDGMGGAAGGEVASHLASRIFLEEARPHEQDESPVWRMKHAIVEANRIVYDEAQRNPHLRGMGTTLVALEIDAIHGRVWTANVGDSRCYRMCDGGLQMLTEDHSFVEEQVRLGLLTEVQAELSPLRNIITRAVGSHKEVAADVMSHGACAGDLYLLCSDGLTRELDDEQIADILLGESKDLNVCADALVRTANAFGGSDNITVILARV